MRKHQFLYTISLLVAIMVFASCLNNNQEGEKNETTCLSLSQKDWRVWAFDDVTVINLMGIFLKLIPLMFTKSLEQTMQIAIR